MLNKKLFLLPLITLSLLNGPVLARGSLDSNPPKIEAKQMDQRAKVLQAYFSKYGSPLKYQAQDFIDAADAYNMDWKLLPAIAGVESTFGKFTPGGYERSSTSYNAWGWGVYGDQAIYFKSWREGMFTVSAGLRQNYLNKGLTDPYAINRIYSTSSRWGGNVTYFLNDINHFEDEYNKYKLSDAAASLTTKTAGTSAQLTMSR